MSRNDLTFLLGGEAGQGIESSATGFAKAIAHAGLHIFDLRDYRSRIRGGHNFAQIRVSAEPITSHLEIVHVLLAMTEEAVRRHYPQIPAGGAILYDEALPVDETVWEAARARGILRFPVPLRKIAEESGGAAVMMNTAVTAAAAGVTRLPFSYIEDIIRTNFGKRGEAMVSANLKVADAAYRYAFTNYAGGFDHTLEPVPDAPRRILLNGNEAFAFGAVAGGCRFAAGYPMTPGSPVLEWLAGHANQYGLVVKHTEDEIAAICMAVGAGHVGARALVPTSGGGFSLMVEALGFAGMSETPVVIYNAQRPGPSTGLPTRQEQGDLLFSLWASQGEFLRVVLAPGTHEEAFEAGWRAFNLAETYQTPVIVLGDHFLATSSRTLELSALDLSKVTVERGKLLSPEELEALSDEYYRYAITDDGISPRAVPGHPKAVYVGEGNEHDYQGRIAEEIEDRVALNAKRLRKLETARQSMRPPKRYGPAEAPVMLVGWGSTVMPALEALRILNAERPTAQYLHITDVWPFPAEAVAGMLKEAQITIAVENNALGQMARLIRQETGIQLQHFISKYDGRPFSPEYIVRGVKEVLHA
ncbi:MAG: 2-oxoacid:acceptor oxidoreductase subunit alpha [Anaerolineae bacterium]